MATNGGLNVHGATIQNAHGLSELNRQLLVQRGAVGKPTHRLREASKKVATMASVVSKLKTLSHRTDESLVLTVNLSVEQLERLEQLEKFLEQTRDPVWQELVASITKTIHENK
ncbi:MAG: hypothetical protein J3Q66DRAFT_399788 [Benniella sp.]|nr:MAG: hypothetical protein J3Q66DRAFT_399788 [Benniella sp.]